MSQSSETIVLGSRSPRRRELFAQMGVNVEVCSPRVEEIVLPGESAVELVKRLAFEKGMDVAARLHEREQYPWVVAADTVVVLDETIMGKPIDTDDAARMLAMLSGRRHYVVTGFAVGGYGGEWTVEHCSTAVTFFVLSRGEIASYVASGESADKAGAYGIQGKGAFLVEKIDGDYNNVVGLPIGQVMRRLYRLGAWSGNLGVGVDDDECE